MAPKTDVREENKILKAAREEAKFFDARYPENKEQKPRKNESLALLVLFFVPVFTFIFALWMAGEIRTGIGNALVWERDAGYWAGLYLEIGKDFCGALLIPGLFSVLTTRPRLTKTVAILAALFILLSFSFLFGAPRVAPAPAPVPVVQETPAPEPAYVPAPVVEIEPEPYIPPPPPVAAAPAPEVRHRSWWLILFPLYAKTEHDFSILFPLHLQHKRDNGSGFLWLFPYFRATHEDGSSNSSFLWPIYTRSSVYENGVLKTEKRIFFFKEK